MSDADIRFLLDRTQIIDVCTRFHWLIDRKAFDQLGTVLNDVVSFPTVADVSDPAFDPENYLDRYHRSGEAFATGVEGMLSGMMTQHLIGGHQVTLQADRAVCVAHSINVHIHDGASADDMVSHGNLYRFDLVRAPAGWRICGMVATIAWSKGDDSLHDVTAKQRAWVESLREGPPETTRS